MAGELQPLRPLHCYDVEKELQLGPVNCCLSCHQDQDAGYEMADYDLPDGRPAYTCCAIMRAVYPDR